MVERLIIDELQLQMADRAGVRISDSELNETITRIAANNGMDLEEFISIMASDGASYEDLREGVREEMIIQRIQRGRVGNEINITEKEFAAYLATDESLINLEPELLVRQILNQAHLQSFLLRAGCVFLYFLILNYIYINY